MTLAIPPATRAVLRLGVRTVLRSRLRSALIVAMIALPVAGVAGADVVYRSHPLSNAQIADQVVGHADGVIAVAPSPGIAQNLTGDTYTVPPSQAGSRPAAKSRTWTAAQVEQALPGITAIRAGHAKGVLVTTKYGALEVDLNDGSLAEAGLRPDISLVGGSWNDATGQVTLDQQVAKRMDVKVGDTITTMATAKAAPVSLNVVGIYTDKWGSPSDGWVTDGSYQQLPGVDTSSSSWAVTRPGGISWSDVQSLNKVGLTVASREVLRDPPPRSQILYDQMIGSTGVSRRTVATLGIAAGLALLQMALLAGPAFAVGAKRRRREMALLSVVGGTRGALFRSMLAESLVLGLIAGVGGTVVGVSVTMLARHLLGGIHGPIRLRGWELLGAFAVGELSAVAGALMPARWASRLDVMAALSGRRADTGNSYRTAGLGGVAVAVGLVLAFAGTVRSETLLILPGVGITELGLLALTPALLAAIARLAPRFGVSIRMALRDASRNRAAAVPALAAVLAVSTVGVATSIYLSSLDARGRILYEPTLSAGTVTAFLPQGLNADVLVAAMRQAVPTLHPVVVGEVDGDNYYCPTDGCREVGVVTPRQDRCPDTGTADDPRCVSFSNVLGVPTMTVLTPGELSSIAGQQVPSQVLAALAAGRVLVASPYQVADGMVTLKSAIVTGSELGQTRPDGRQQAPAEVWKPTSGLRTDLVLTPATAARLGLATHANQVMAVPPSPMTNAQQQALTAATARYGTTADFEDGYIDEHKNQELIALIATALIALAATMLATGLAVVDSRADLATLWAVGASPGMRRRLSASRAGLLSTLGAVMGTAIGFIPPIVVLKANHQLGNVNPISLGVAVGERAGRIHLPLAVPWWPNLIGTLVLVPVVGVVVATVVTRARPVTASSQND